MSKTSSKHKICFNQNNRIKVENCKQMENKKNIAAICMTIKLFKFVYN